MNFKTGLGKTILWWARLTVVSLIYTLLSSCQPASVPTAHSIGAMDQALVTYVPHEWEKLIQSDQETPFVSAIAAAPDGGVWVGTDGSVASAGTGVYYFDGRIWTHYTQENGLASNEINAIAVGPDGVVWFGTACCGVSRFDGGSWTTFTTANGLASNYITSIAIASDRSVWFGTIDSGISRFDGKSWQTYTMTNGLWGNIVLHLFILPNGSLLAESSTDASLKLMLFDGKKWSDYPTPFTFLTGNKYGTGGVVATPDGSLWFATYGLYRLSGGNWTHYTTSDGLPGDYILCIAEAPDGTLWLGTDQGIARIKNGKIVSNDPVDSFFKGEEVSSIAVSPNGEVWLRAPIGVSRYIPPSN